MALLTQAVAVQFGEGHQMVRGEGESVTNEFDWPARVVQALDSLRVKLGQGSTAREAEMAEALDECISRMRRGESVAACSNVHPATCKLIGMMLSTTQSASPTLEASRLEQFMASPRVQREIRLEDRPTRTLVIHSDREKHAGGIFSNAWITLVRALAGRRVQGAVHRPKGKRQC